jgi:hypothetical protein
MGGYQALSLMGIRDGYLKYQALWVSEMGGYQALCRSVHIDTSK